ncbi:MAG: PASTA domain-containing protein [Clostridiales bacterium]|jgi:stage V sporulation protein D (sporulation-specific penicillin-binding protein)|nr:PASTA domain-containing protein [Clostridiales bacterium]
MKTISIVSKKKLMFFLWFAVLMCAVLAARVFYIQAFKAEYLQKKAYEQQTRDRLIAPNRGAVLDRNMVGLAKTETVASVSVINSQVQDKEFAARVLSERLELDYDTVLKKVSKRLALERIKTKVPKDLADEIRKLNLPGVVVDEDIKRVYPYSNLASHVLGFVGRDNQGIIGLEAKYDSYLKGSPGKILTETDVRGIDIVKGEQVRQPPVDGYNLVLTLDVILQQYAEQTLQKVLTAKGAKRGAIILMNPQNGELLAMANQPDFDLNDPFTINNEELAAIWGNLTEEERNNHLNQMWRNFSINDTYEPGSTFKIVTAASGLEEKVVNTNSMFVCTASRLVGGRQIKCWRYPRSHGALNFVQGVQQSCNPVFMETAERLGAEVFHNYLLRFGFDKKTGVDLPGEAVGIMHKADKIGPVELATMSFGQGFQITPLQLLRAASATVNGGYLVTPHFAQKITDDAGNTIEEFVYERGNQVISPETSETMKSILESVVASGTGSRTYIPGYRIGGKTATSEKLPRRSGKYIASFMALAPAENPQVIALVLVDEPQGAYYGGQVAGPVMKELLENALPYLKIEPVYTEAEKALPEAAKITVPDIIGQKVNEAVKILKNAGAVYQLSGEGANVKSTFPLPGEVLNKGSKIIIYTEATP